MIWNIQEGQLQISYYCAVKLSFSIIIIIIIIIGPR
jgi:hypothetical protein